LYHHRGFDDTHFVKMAGEWETQRRGTLLETLINNGIRSHAGYTPNE
jgi:hypothetical protein